MKYEYRSGRGISQERASDGLGSRSPVPRFRSRSAADLALESAHFYLQTPPDKELTLQQDVQVKSLVTVLLWQRGY